MSSSPALEITGARVRLGGSEGFELASPDVVLDQASAMACVGPSGSGKTTLVRLASGLLRHDSGTVRTLGVDLAQMGDQQIRSWRVRHIGLVFQDFALLAHLSGLENILLPFIIGPGMRAEREQRQRAHELASSVEVSHTLTRRPHRMSHGERQRIAICRSLVTRPGLLLCDEPTASLDAHRADLVLAAIDRERTERGASILITTHDHAVAQRIGSVIDLSPVAAS